MPSHTISPGLFVDAPSFFFFPESRPVSVAVAGVPPDGESAVLFLVDVLAPNELRAARKSTAG